ncbi:hypothetical protein ABBQ32_008156 [Trebouxia sp. C0010 RCD-2024]
MPLSARLQKSTRLLCSVYVGSSLVLTQTDTMVQSVQLSKLVLITSQTQPLTSAVGRAERQRLVAKLTAELGTDDTHNYYVQMGHTGADQLQKGFLKPCRQSYRTGRWEEKSWGPRDAALNSLFSKV